MSAVSDVAHRQRPRRGLLRRRAWDIFGVFLFVVLVFPVFWMVSTAFKPDDEINSLTPTWISTSPPLDHFRDAVNRPFFWDTVKNSLIVVCVAVLASIVLAFVAAVALAKYRFTGRKVFIALMIGILMLPAVGLIIPIYVVLARYGLTVEDVLAMAASFNGRPASAAFARRRAARAACQSPACSCFQT